MSKFYFKDQDLEIQITTAPPETPERTGNLGANLIFLLLAGMILTLLLNRCDARQTQTCYGLINNCQQGEKQP